MRPARHPASPERAAAESSGCLTPPARPHGPPVRSGRAGGVSHAQSRGGWGPIRHLLGRGPLELRAHRGGRDREQFLPAAVVAARRDGVAENGERVDAAALAFTAGRARQRAQLERMAGLCRARRREDDVGHTLENAPQVGNWQKFRTAVSSCTTFTRKPPAERAGGQALLAPRMSGTWGAVPDGIEVPTNLSEPSALKYVGNTSGGSLPRASRLLSGPWRGLGGAAPGGMESPRRRIPCTFRAA